MTKTVQEAFDVEKHWRESGKVMQVGVQSTSLPVWDEVRALLQEGKLGKVLGFQTEYFRNSDMGQWRYYKLEKEMTPKSVDWKRWLGTEEGLSEERPFDREVYKQWRRFWPFGSGMFTDLFVHRTTNSFVVTMELSCSVTAKVSMDLTLSPNAVQSHTFAKRRNGSRHHLSTTRRGRILKTGLMPVKPMIQ